MSDEKKPIDPAVEPSENASEQGEVGVEQLKAMIAALQADLDKKTAEVSAKQDQFLRAAAEMENVRRRLEKEKEDIAKYAISKSGPTGRARSPRRSTCRRDRQCA